MTRLLALAVGAALVASPVAHAATTPAKKPTTRTVTFAYQGAAGTHAVVFTGTLCTDTTCTAIPLESYETKASISATDSSGQKVPLLTSVDSTDSLTCGSADVTLAKSTELDLATVVDPTCAGVPTTGTVTVTITGLK